MILKPPRDGLEYNGAKATAEGVEVAAADVDALKAAGWTAATPAKPKKQKIPALPEETAEEKTAASED
ncbi:MAG: hypothetical protein CMJ20_02560 [Phycisphaeraceae bacterium]|nr:hypothetical protein [Phycisphaeraceae bacterium]|tara:strand:- start:2003 stop:2206 length:204 start_codon:yes stop_codon:yes gene_type:complete